MLVPQLKKAKELEGYPKIHRENWKGFGITRGFLLLHIFSFPFSEKDAPKKISLQYPIWWNTEHDSPACKENNGQKDGPLFPLPGLDEG